MNHSITIREYEPTDKDAVINLIRLNIPKYFAPTEETDLNYYLDHERELYYVLLFDGQIVGCGGINFEDNKTTGSEGEILSCNPVLPEVERDFVKKNIEGVCSRKQFQWLYVLS